MKRALLIAPPFFGYRQRIADELRSQGYEVKAVDDRPSQDVVFKSISKVAPKLLTGSIERYSEELCSRVASGGYTKVIYLGGMTFLFNQEQIQKMRSMAPGTEFIAYLWDSLANSSRLARCLELFDRVLSFDPKDCKQNGLSLRPLFFSDVYSSLALKPENGFTWDACFVGSVHQVSKFETVETIARTLRLRGFKVFTYYFMPSGSVELLRRIQRSSYREVRLERTPLSAADVAGIYESSRAVIDSPQSGQQGLTMRTLETVGARRKLITANSDVLNYDFAKPTNVALWDSKQEFDPTFFSEDYEALFEASYKSYSIAAFVRALLGEGPDYSGYMREVDAK